MLRICLACLAALGTATGAFASYLVAISNFHTVIEGHLYRSAQPSAAQIAAWRDRYGIRTVINLTGARPGDPRYDAERAAAERAGITLVDYKLAASREVTAGELDDLIGILDAAQAPILIHCYRGADRTSLVSALYLAAVAGASEARAEWQFAPVYGHVSIPFLPAFAMDSSFESAEPRLGFLGS